MRLYNSLTKNKEAFKTLQDNTILLYVCGITPYDVTHLGHASTYIFFDVLYRYLLYKGYHVTYTQNVTDIDDDILKQAKKVGQNWRELGDYWTNFYLEDMKNLNVLSPTHFVKATDSIPKIIEIISRLHNKNAAYVSQGNVYFDVTTYKEYGQLSHYNDTQMIDLLNERGGNSHDPLKKNPLDFLLWQSSKSDVLSKVEGPSWNSPWGAGRPGWHIECSAMIDATLGRQIDIHGGGYDLIFPHHESETAQSESYTHRKPFVSYWMHVAMVKYQGEKMSKSLGNLILARDLLKKYSANTIRFYLLSHHYRETWEFFEKDLDEANEQMNLIQSAINVGLSDDVNFLRPGPLRRRAPIGVKKLTSNGFTALMDDDLDTPAALSLMLELAKKNDTYGLRTILKILGFQL